MTFDPLCTLGDMENRAVGMSSLVNCFEGDRFLTSRVSRVWNVYFSRSSSR